MNMYTFNQIPSETQIKKFLRRTVFGSHVYCPWCRSRNVYVTQERYRCRSCRRRFSLLSHTWLSNLKLPLEQFWMVLWCWTTRIPVLQAMALTQLSEKAIRHWYDVFREHLPYQQVVLERIVQMDEAYFGGKDGRTLLMAKEVGTGKLAFEILNHTNPAREHAWEFLQHYILPETQLNTDGGSIYQEIEHWWPIDHRVDIHKQFEFGLTSEIEGIFGVLRTFIRRMYHHVTCDKLPMLVAEFCYRFCHKEMFENPRFYLQNTLQLVPTG